MERIRWAPKDSPQTPGPHTMTIDRNTQVRCRHCGAILPGWLPWARAPHPTLLMGHLQLRHRAEFRPLLARMATEDIDAVAMEGVPGVNVQKMPRSSQGGEVKVF